MIYLDNAATTFPKPSCVEKAITNALKKYGANPGRSSHTMSFEAAEEIYKCRKVTSHFFNAQGPECVVFTANCTHATNIVIKGCLKEGDHIVISCMEHNAVTRPVHALREIGVTSTQASLFYDDNDMTLDSFRQAITPKTKLIACIHASNVFGYTFPIERITALAHQYEIPVMVDAAQTAGVIPIDLNDTRIDYLCISGHKGLYGPMGTGLLITNKGEHLNTLIEGGTGTNSLSQAQPKDMPEHLESGTPNMPGISGLRAGIEFVSRTSIDKIAKHEYNLALILYNGLSSIKNIELYTPAPTPKHFVPLVSFNITNRTSEETSSLLNERGVCVRSGLHCAPSAHKYMGTLDKGSVRICPSIFTTLDHVKYFLRAIRNIVKYA